MVSVRVANRELSAWLSPLCSAAIAELGARLSDGVTADDCHDAFLCAGAYLVWADFIAAGTPGSFTAGDVTVRNDAADMIDAAAAKTAAETAVAIASAAVEAAQAVGKRADVEN